MTADTPPVFEADFATQFDTLLRWRRDVRQFLPSPIADADLEALFDTAALAPSVGNAQPWRFVRVRSACLRTGLTDHVEAVNARAAAAQPDEDRRARYDSLKLHGLREAPEIVAVFSDESPIAGHTLGRATMHETLRYSTVMAIHTLWLAARLRGIGLGWVSIVDPTAVAAMLDVPQDWTLIAVLCLGYPEHPSIVPELERRDWQCREPIADRIIER
ncbi:5,6-dimethylbenzimidazole synthase [Sphingomonas sp. Leaf38]|uniref:5,6-dimethylbenzimidazole synthase n=1 Tax=Sphingomonas sp. Leaf38 TaxID=1736217 RepID=UPI0006F5CDAD|nr:5,6-dimethylbenzimidazole synthase [Sphingomonas sp. Leaf38]KQN32955.1 5,6-dimethylbenzimidazole synthase [Sphingomonas sp. Leaf38]